ncbi:MAG: NAD(+)/NADH kinase [Rikenellaceae bacterium]
MKIILFSRSRVSHVAADLRLLFTEIELRGFQYSVNEEFVPILEEILGISFSPDMIYGNDVGDQPEDAVMICYGGDGTLLEGVHRLSGRKIIVVGINSGRLGFLTCVSRSGISELFENLEQNKLRVESRVMLAVKGDFSGGEWLTAVNEFAVQRKGASMIAVETRVDGELIATYHGDGVIVSTPTGSTAYSLSVGGPVISPHCGCFIVSPLAPHNITMRPVALPDKSVVDLSIRMREGDAVISIDNRIFPIGAESEVVLQKAESKFYLGLNRNISFYQTLRDKMMWGVDLRD